VEKTGFGTLSNILPLQLWLAAMIQATLDAVLPRTEQQSSAPASSIARCIAPPGRETGPFAARKRYTSGINLPHCSLFRKWLRSFHDNPRSFRSQPLFDYRKKWRNRPPFGSWRFSRRATGQLRPGNSVKHTIAIRRQVQRRTPWCGNLNPSAWSLLLNADACLGKLLRFYRVRWFQPE
jgi:hypothetical protein